MRTSPQPFVRMHSWKKRKVARSEKHSDDKQPSESLKSTTTLTPALTPTSSGGSQTSRTHHYAGTSSNSRCVCGGCTCQGSFIDAQSLSSSHNTSASDYHITLDAWLSDVSTAVNAAWSKRHMDFSDVHVLMISWEENDIPHMNREMTRLRNVWVDQFGYQAYDLAIPSLKADLTIRRKVDEFIELYGDQDNLLIIYYAGHAKPGAHSGAPPIWHSR